MAEKVEMDLFGDEFAVAAPAPAEVVNPNIVTEDDAADGEPVAGVTSESAQSDELVQEIDLGDGGGKQVFKAKSATEMIAKLTKAQENATRKIRQQEFELQRQKRATPDKTARPTAKQLTADDKFALAQEFAKDPEAALDKLLAAKGLTTTDLVDGVTERAVARAEAAFLSKHAGEFLPSPDNAKAMQKFLSDEGLAYTAPNLEYAFQELSEGGLLDMPSSDAQDSEGESTESDQRIVVPQHTRRKPMSTGLTQKQSSGVRAVVEKTTASGITESEVEEIYNLPMEQARKKMLAHMRRIEGPSGSRK